VSHVLVVDAYTFNVLLTGKFIILYRVLLYRVFQELRWCKRCFRRYLWLFLSSWVLFTNIIGLRVFNFLVNPLVNRSYKS